MARIGLTGWKVKADYPPLASPRRATLILGRAWQKGGYGRSDYDRQPQARPERLFHWFHGCAHCAARSLCSVLVTTLTRSGRFAKSPPLCHPCGIQQLGKWSMYKSIVVAVALFNKGATKPRVESKGANKLVDPDGSITLVHVLDEVPAYLTAAVAKEQLLGASQGDPGAT